MTFEKALEAMKQGEKVYRKAWYCNCCAYIGFESIPSNPDSEIFLTIIQDGVEPKKRIFSRCSDFLQTVCDDWEIYGEPQEEIEITAEKAVAIMKIVKDIAKHCGVTKIDEYRIDEVIEAYDFAIESLENKNKPEKKCPCNCSCKNDDEKRESEFEKFAKAFNIVFL